MTQKYYIERLLLVYISVIQKIKEEHSVGIYIYLASSVGQVT